MKAPDLRNVAGGIGSGFDEPVSDISDVQLIIHHMLMAILRPIDNDTRRGLHVPRLTLDKAED